MPPTLSKLFPQLRTLSNHYHCRHRILPFRLFSFSTPEEAAADRRRRKRRLRIEPPADSLPRYTPRSPSSKKGPNPDLRKFPETISALSGDRLDLHNQILSMLRTNQHKDAVLLVQHSFYSKCRPTIFTANAVLNHLLCLGRYADLFSLHRFLILAGMAPNVVSYNVLLQAYCESRKIDIALETYEQMLNGAPFDPSPTTNQIVVKGLIDNGRTERALELLRKMQERGFRADPIVFNLLMSGLAKKGVSEFDRILGLFEELKGKTGHLGGEVYGTMMVAYFMKGMEKEAMDLYNEFLGVKYKITAAGYNSVLDALIMIGKFESHAIGLFDSMLNIHDPPMRLVVNSGSFNLMVDGYFIVRRFQEAMELFRKMGDHKCSPDVLSYSNMIKRLCKSELVAEAGGFLDEMLASESIKSDQQTPVLLLDACFELKRLDDAIGYLEKTVDSGLMLNVSVYNRLFTCLFCESRRDAVKKLFEKLVGQGWKPTEDTYDILLKGFGESGHLPEMLNVVARMLDDGTGLAGEKLEFVKSVLKEEGKEGELQRLYDEQAEKERLAREEKERQERKKAESFMQTKEVTHICISKVHKMAIGSSVDREENAQAPDAEVVDGEDDNCQLPPSSLPSDYPTSTEEEAITI